MTTHFISDEPEQLQSLHLCWKLDGMGPLKGREEATSRDLSSMNRVINSGLRTVVADSISQCVWSERGMMTGPRPGKTDDGNHNSKL